MNRPVVVYLDSQDFSRFGDVLRGKSDPDTERIFSELRTLREAGTVIFGVSMPLMSELLQFHPDHRETSLRKAEAIEMLCGHYAFPTPMKLAATEIAIAANAIELTANPPEIRIPSSDRGWFPGFGSALVDFRETIQAAALRSLESKVSDPRLRGQVRAMLADVDWSGEIEAFAPELADHFQLPVEAISDTLVPLFGGDIAAEEASRRMFSSISQPTAFVHIYFERLDGDSSLPRWMKGAGQTLANSINRIANEIREIAGPNSKRKHFRPILAPLRGHFAAAAIELARISADEIRLSDEVIDQFSSGPQAALSLPSGQIIAAVLESYLLQILGATATSAKIEKSFAGDLMHALYLPYVDLWRGDRRFSALLANAVPEYQNRIVRSLSDLPSAISRSI
jgi:hypothetical protein